MRDSSILSFLYCTRERMYDDFPIIHKFSLLIYLETIFRVFSTFQRVSKRVHGCLYWLVNEKKLMMKLDCMSVVRMTVQILYNQNIKMSRTSVLTYSMKNSNCLFYRNYKWWNNCIYFRSTLYCRVTSYHKILISYYFLCYFPKVRYSDWYICYK